MAKEPTTPVTTRLTPTTLARIDAWARVEKRTRYNMISLMLEDYLDSQSGNGDISGSADDNTPAEDGRVVHEEVDK